MAEPLPDQMTGNDLRMQEEHELQIDRNYFDGMDKVDRRDRRGEITSFVASRKYRQGFDLIRW